MATDKDSKAPDNPLAFPQPLVCTSEGRVYRADETAPYAGGMTLRDYFAAHAPALGETAWIGITVAAEQQGDFLPNVATVVATWAYVYADTMLAERSKGAQS